VTGSLAKRIALAAALVALGAGLFLWNFERREVEVPRGRSIEAIRNKYLALSRLLERMGHPVSAQRELAKLAQLPEPPATVFLPLNRAALGAQRSQALLDWVARGGHLVVVTYTVWGVPEDEDRYDTEQDVIVSGRPDLLLDRFGLRQRHVDSAPFTSEHPAVEAETEELPEEAGPPPTPPTLGDLLRGDFNGASRETAYATIEEGDEPLALEFDADFWWDDTLSQAVWTVAGDAGAHLVEVEHGEGRIAALTSDEPLANATLGLADHAEFVVRWLREGRDVRAPVWIFSAAEWPSLPELMRRHAAPVLVAGAALFALWLWRASFRFGPALPAPDGARRRWLEHLEAAGRFHWRQDRGRVLLGSLREDLLRDLERRRPAWPRLPEAERWERLAHASGLTPEQVVNALRGEARTPRSFGAAVRALERLRAAL
jgi:hypothetical protein